MEKQPAAINERLNLQIERMPIGCITWDTKFRVQSWNPAAEKIFGFSKEEAIGKHPYDIIVPKSAQPQVDKIWSRLLQGDMTAQSVNGNITKDGRTIVCDWQNTPLKQSDGRVLGVLSIVQDITEQKQAVKDLENARTAAQNILEDLEVEKKELAEAKAKDEALIESIGEGLVAIDQDGKVIIVNKMAEKLLGFTSAELIGKSFVQAVSLENEQGEQISEAQRPAILALNSDTTTTTTTTTAYYFVCKNGTKFPAAITATPVLLDAKPIGAIVVFHDITKEKELEKMRTDFLSLASHQLRTPLSGTKWLIGTLMHPAILGPLTEKQKVYLNDIYNINERMIQLVSDMLSALRLQGEKADMKEETVFVSDLYRSLLKIVRPATKDKKWVVLRSALTDEKLTVKTDVQILRSILESFISNAINYSPPGGTVILDAKEEAAAVVFSVKDNGIGIPKEEQKRIFERFYRASSAKRLKPDGTGLGLYIAKTLAEKIGAEVAFESEENKGSIFYLRLPKKG